MSVRPLMHSPNFNGMPTVTPFNGLGGLPYPSNPAVLGWASSPMGFSKTLGTNDAAKKLQFWNALPQPLQQQFLDYQNAKPIPGLDGFTAKSLLAPTANGSIYSGAPIYAQGFGVVFTVFSSASPGQFAQIGPFFNKIDIAQTIKNNVDKPGFWHNVSGGNFLNDIHNKLRSLIKAGLKPIIYTVTAPLKLAPKGTVPAKIASKINTAIVNNPLTTGAVLAAATGATLATAPTATTAATTTAPTVATTAPAVTAPAITAPAVTAPALTTVTGGGLTTLLPKIGNDTASLIKNLTPIAPLLTGGPGGPVSPGDVSAGGGTAPAPAPASGLQKVALPALLAIGAFFLFNS